MQVHKSITLTVKKVQSEKVHHTAMIKTWNKKRNKQF